MKRLLIFAYGVVCYAVFFATFLYAIGFLSNLWVPKSIDSAREVPLVTALLTNLGLLALFAVQHSVMARPAFKRWWTRIVPEFAERSTYTLFSSLALVALFAFWQPMGGVIWNVASPVGQAVLYAAFAFGWGLLLLSTFLINHFDLFGLRQVWLQLIDKLSPARADAGAIHEAALEEFAMKRRSIFVYGVACCAVSFATLLYATNLRAHTP
jgi:protein-S-isoprenylcysteine O-methyltransferase Ste14